MYFVKLIDVKWPRKILNLIYQSVKLILQLVKETSMCITGHLFTNWELMNYKDSQDMQTDKDVYDKGSCD